jgi:hypothetical protein
MDAPSLNGIAGNRIGLAKIAAATSTLIFIDSSIAPRVWHPLVLAFVLIGLTVVGLRYVRLVLCALIVLPLALASALAGEPAGWLLMVLITLHWLDICAAAPAEKLAVRHAVRLAGLGLIGLTAVVWYRLEGV